MSCSDCAYKEETPIVECNFCIRNPSLASTRFTPTVYKSHEVTKPLDMYISKEHMAIIRRERSREYLELLKLQKVPEANPNVPPQITWEFPIYKTGDGTGYPQSFWQYSGTVWAPTARVWYAGDTFAAENTSVSWSDTWSNASVFIPMDSGITWDGVGIVDIGSGGTVEKKGKEKKLICSSPEEVLEGLEGVEVDEVK